jgi:hypothetical protein
LGPANQGLPGAQYALGAILLSREKYQEALGWLERAVASDLPPAAHLLGTIYVQSTDSGTQDRGRALLRLAVCSGYPPAQGEDVKATAGHPDCGTTTRPPFDGTWTATLDWVKSPPAGGKPDRVRVVATDGAAEVFVRSGDDWIEVKPGEFNLGQVGDTLYLSAIDSGWDLDGKWVESWTVQILRSSASEGIMSFVRTVNNVYLPETTGLRAFTSVAEGRATRQ